MYLVDSSRALFRPGRARPRLLGALYPGGGPTKRRAYRAGASAFGAIALSVILALPGCAALTKPWAAPEVVVTSIKPERVALDEQTLLVGLRIRNPNDRMLPIKALSYRLSLEGDEIATGSGKLERQIPAFGEASAEVSATGSAARLAAKLPTLMLQSRPWQYQIAGTVTVAGVVPIPYRYSGELDATALLLGAGWRQ